MPGDKLPLLIQELQAEAFPWGLPATQAGPLAPWAIRSAATPATWGEAMEVPWKNQ